MKEIKGDYWELAPDYEALVCTTNKIIKKDGRLVMGAGIAKDFKNKFEGLDKIWGVMTLKYEDTGVYAALSSPTEEDPKEWLLFSFPTKYNWKDKSDLQLIYKSLKTLVTVCNCFGLEKILITRPGCGNGGFSWENNMENACRPFLDDRFTVVSK